MSQELAQKIRILEERLKEAEGTLEAIRKGKIDAIVVQGKELPEIYTLKSADFTYRVLIERMNEGAAILSKEGIVLYSNNKLTEILGTNKKELVGNFLSDFLLASEREKLDIILKKGINQAINQKVYFVRPHDGQLKSLLFSANPMPAESGADIGLIVTDLSEVEEKEKLQKLQVKLEEMVVDRTRRLQEAHEELKAMNERLAHEIEEHKRTEQELIRKEQEIDEIINSAAEGILGVDKNGVCTFVNNSCLTLLGYDSRDEVVGKKVQKILAPRCDMNTPCPEKDSKIFKAIKDGTVQSATDMFFRKKDGRYFPVGYLVHPIRSDSRTRGAVISFWDFSQQRALEEKLKQMAKVLEQSLDLIVITDVDGTIEYVNPAFEKNTGYSLEELKDKTPKILLSEDNSPDFCQKLLENLKEGKNWQGTITCKRKNGEVFKCLTVFFPIRNDSGEIINYAFVQRDISAEEQLREQMYQAQKLESLGKLTGGVAHDFNNLLTVINGFSKLGLELINKDHPLHSYLQQIYRAGERASHLTSQLLTFSRKQVISPRQVNINEIFKETQKMLQRLIGEDIKLIFQFDEKVKPIKADVTQIDQILMNLVVNARDAILEKENAEEKKIVVSTRQVEVSQKMANKYLDLNPGPHVLIEVKDTGIGMTDEVKEHIFEPFFTTKKEGRGTGLGLSTVYGIIKQNQAFIQVKSKPGVGTTFSIYWPNYLQEDQNQPEQKEAQVAQGRQQLVLIVEDDPEVRSLLEASLKKLNYKVMTAANGAEALKIINTAKDEIDAIITDLVMPEIDGVTLAKKVREMGVAVPVLFGTGYADEHLEKIVESDYSRFILQKPYRLEELAKKLNEVLKD
ncbi:PAS domain-containing hybrid sensor histidine kinase/response regulator [Calditrichota bacterium GD2]